MSEKTNAIPIFKEVNLRCEFSYKGNEFTFVTNQYHDRLNSVLLVLDTKGGFKDISIVNDDFKLGNHFDVVKNLFPLLWLPIWKDIDLNPYLLEPIIDLVALVLSDKDSKRGVRIFSDLSAEMFLNGSNLLKFDNGLGDTYLLSLFYQRGCDYLMLKQLDKNNKLTHLEITKIPKDFHFGHTITGIYQGVREIFTPSSLNKYNFGFDSFYKSLPNIYDQDMLDGSFFKLFEQVIETRLEDK